MLYFVFHDHLRIVLDFHWVYPASSPVSYFDFSHAHVHFDLDEQCSLDVVVDTVQLGPVVDHSCACFD